MSAKQKTKKVLLWMGAAICCLACNKECPEKIIYKTIHDTIDKTCYECIDSAYFAREDQFHELVDQEIAKIDSLKTEAVKEALIFRDMAQYQVDTMRENMFAERDRIVAMLQAMKDSLIISHDNLTIIPDSTWRGSVEAVFDEQTGKPKLVWK